MEHAVPPLRGSRFGSNLVVIELALAIILLTSAGLLGKSFYRILHVDLNFNPAHLATLEIDANNGYDTAAQQLALSRRLETVSVVLPGFNLREWSAPFQSLATAIQSPTVRWAARGMAHSSWQSNPVL